MDNETVIPIHDEMIFNSRKRKSATTWINLEHILLSEIGQPWKYTSHITLSFIES